MFDPSREVNENGERQAQYEGVEFQFELWRPLSQQLPEGVDSPFVGLGAPIYLNAAHEYEASCPESYTKGTAGACMLSFYQRGCIARTM